MSDTPTPLIDTSQMNEAEQQLVSLFERRAASSPDEVAPTSAEEEVEPASPPASPDSTAAPVPPTQVEGLDESGTENAPLDTPSATQDGAPAPEGDAVVDDAVPAGSADSTAAFTFAGRDYAPEEIAQAVQLHGWFKGLSNEQIAAMDALMSGQYRLVPANEAAPVPPTPAAPTTPAISSAPSPTATGSPIVDDAEEWLDPRAAQEINALRAELAQLQQSVQQSVTPLIQQQHDASLNQTISQIDAATNDFISRYNLTPEQAEPILQAVAEAQILPGLQARHGGDVKAAMQAGLDMMFWTTPSFRDSYIQSKTAADLADLAAQERNAKVKQQQMTALSASGGSVPRRDPKPTNKEDRHAAMVAEIAAAQNGQ